MKYLQINRKRFSILKSHCFILFFFIINFNFLHAKPFTLSKHMEGVLLNENISIYKDKTRKMKIENILENKHLFKKNEINSKWDSYPDASVWLQLTVLNSFDEDIRWIITHEATWLDQIEICIEDGDDYIIKQGGDLIPFHQREIAYRKNSFYVNTKAKSTETIYIRMNYKYLDSMFLDTLAYTEKELFDEKAFENLIFGILIGAFWIFALYNIIIGYSIRDITYLYFAIYLISNSFFLLFHFGIGFQYIWSNSMYMTSNGLFLIWNTVIIAGIKMMQNFLEVSRTKWMKKVSDIWISFTAITMLIGILGFYKVAYYFSYLSTYFAVIYTLFSYIRWREGMKDAKYFLISWIFFFIGLFTNIARELSYLQPSGSSMWAYPVGFLTQACFISLAFAGKVKTLREEKEKLFIEKQELLESSKKKLEKEVEKRTNQLKESELRYELLIENSPDAIVVHDGRKLIFVNKSTVNLIHAKNKEEIINRPIKDFIHPDSLKSMKRRYKSAFLKSDKILMPEEHKLIGLDGKILDFESVDVLFSYDDKPTFLSIIRDITERKRVERLRKDTEQILRHDIKNPLFAVTGFSELLLDKEMPENVRDYASNIFQAGQQILDLLTSSMDLFKMEEGTFVPKNENIDIIKIIKEVKKEFVPILERKSVLLDTFYNREIFLDESAIFINGQTLHIKSMFRNLVKNAIEASPEGEKVSITIYNKNKQYDILIHNRGIIPISIRNRFFERYSTSGKESGTGLGAYSALLIAKSHKGNITFSSSEKDGTSLLVTLPKNIFHN